MNQVLEMFHNILKMFHDGLILTEGEDIVYANSAVREIYDDEEVVEGGDVDERERKGEEREKEVNDEEDVKKAIKETIRDADSQGEGGECLNERESLWEFIRKEEESEREGEPQIKGVGSRQYFSYSDRKSDQ
jgi:hypothetical protein